MTVNYEIKSQLAKLLATEDLMVENRDVETAQFDVHTRVLTLPLWKRASNLVYDLLVGHEVGHALFTPDEDWTKKINVPQQFVNVCEDARIEKLMKRKYPGLAKTFYNGYNELNEQDFFELDGEDISSFNLADRANLYFKSSSFLSISFSSAEKQIVDLIGASETFEDTLNASKVLYEYCAHKQEEEKQENLEEEGIQQTIDLSSDGGNDLDETTSEEELNKEPEKEPTRSPSEDPAQLDTPSYEQPKVYTDDLLNEKLSEFNDSRSGREVVNNLYCEVPKIDIDEVIINNERVHQELDEAFHLQDKDDYDVYNAVDEDYRSFKKSAQKEVSYLVKEFECKKAADAYARTAVAKTGVLDTSKLHTYKFNEDIFRKISVVADGKNHGLIFILDWSGSMNSCLLSTIKQLYNLIWFCQKVQIPFEVYALSNAYYNREMIEIPRVSEPIENEFYIEHEFRLLNFFSSKGNKAKLEQHLVNIWRLAYSMNYQSRWNCRYCVPDRYTLGGTPLNETIVALHRIIPQFKKENKVQKVQCIILTDGEAGPLPVYKTYTDYRDGEEKLGCRRWSPENSYLRNRKTGHTYKLPHEFYKFTEILLNDLKRMHPDVNFIGMRVLAPRDFNSFIRRYEYMSEEQMKKAKKDKTYSIKDCGYDTYFAIMDSALSNDDEFVVQEDATKAQIKRAFVKSLKTKKLNKKVLGEFIELVA